MLKKLLSLSLTLALSLSLCACDPSAPSDADTQITNAGMTLSVPAKYRDLLLIDLEPGFSQRKMHFRVSEKASADAAKTIFSEDHTGGGLLFGIGRVTKDEFRELMCREMAGAEVFAVDENENYYMSYYPTDVQLLREGEGYTDADWAIWSELCAWAAGAPDRFIADNPGLTPCRRSNSELDILLNRLLHWQNVPFTLTHSGTGKSLQPSCELSQPYLEQLTAGLVSPADNATPPVGEYITLQIPEEDARFDFFLGDSGLFRQIFSDGRSSFYRINCDCGTPAGRILLDWHTAAANTQ